MRGNGCVSQLFYTRRSCKFIFRSGVERYRIYYFIDQESQVKNEVICKWMFEARPFENYYFQYLNFSNNIFTFL